MSRRGDELDSAAALGEVGEEQRVESSGEVAH
jgi:hypothetical protein